MIPKQPTTLYAVTISFTAVILILPLISRGYNTCANIHHSDISRHSARVEPRTKGEDLPSWLERNDIHLDSLEGNRHELLPSDQSWWGRIAKVYQQKWGVKIIFDRQNKAAEYYPQGKRIFFPFDFLIRPLKHMSTIAHELSHARNDIIFNHPDVIENKNFNTAFQKMPPIEFIRGNPKFGFKILNYENGFSADEIQSYKITAQSTSSFIERQWAKYMRKKFMNETLTIIGELRQTIESEPLSVLSNGFLSKQVVYSKGDRDYYAKFPISQKFLPEKEADLKLIMLEMLADIEIQIRNP